MSEPGPFPFWRRASFWWTIFALALTVRIVHRPESHTVFPIFAQGSFHWWNGASLYLDYKPLDFFRYPPLFAILFTPFALLGPTAGGVAWAFFSLAIYGVGLSRFHRVVLPERIDGKGRHLYFNFALLGGVLGLWNGQCNALIVGLLLLAGAALAERRWWTASLWMALACSCKLTPVPMVLLLCALWPRHLAGRFTLVLAGLVLIPFLVKPATEVMEQYRGFVHQLTEQSDKRWPGFRDGWLVWSVSRHLLEGSEGLPDLEAPIDEPGYRVLQLTTAGFLLVAVLCLRRRNLESRWLILMTMASGASWCLLFGPASEAPTYVLVAPFLAWGYVDRKACPFPSLIRTAVLFLLLLGWGGFTRALWTVAPWLILTLPTGVFIFSLWLFGMAVVYCRPDEETIPESSLRLSRPFSVEI